jgi:hypothetical protein
LRRLALGIGFIYLALFSLMVPIALLLIVSLLLIGRRLDPAFAAEA